MIISTLCPSCAYAVISFSSPHGSHVEIEDGESFQLLLDLRADLPPNDGVQLLLTPRVRLYHRCVCAQNSVKRGDVAAGEAAQCRRPDSLLLLSAALSAHQLQQHPRALAPGALLQGSQQSVRPQQELRLPANGR